MNASFVLLFMSNSTSLLLLFMRNSTS